VGAPLKAGLSAEADRLLLSPFDKEDGVAISVAIVRKCLAIRRRCKNVIGIVKTRPMEATLSVGIAHVLEVNLRTDGKIK
jgi:hypothetical protein